ncbi:MAG: hypothetical protein PHY34_02755, partial [Patescibacteria group bacterium]|nr:hypothetical protein [Patescibacteria group bacterium]
MHEKVTKRILLALFIVAASAVLGGGLLLVVWQRTHEPAQEITPELPNPELELDSLVKDSALNYVEKPYDSEKNAITFYSGNAQYKTPEGRYAEIDTTIRETTGEFAYENTTNAFKTYYRGASAADGMIKYSIPGDRGVTFGFKEPKTVQAVAEGNTVTYPDIYDGVDAKYTVTADSLIEEAVITKPEAAQSITQHVELQGIYFREEKDGSVSFHDSTTKNRVFNMPRPVMYERDNPGNQSFGLHYEITKAESGYDITKVIDQEGAEWLTTATLPVVVDFTYTYNTASQQPSNDSGELFREYYGYPVLLRYSLRDLSDVTLTSQRDARELSMVSPDGALRSLFSFSTSNLNVFDQAEIFGGTFNVYMYRYYTGSYCSWGTGNYISAFSGADAWSSWVSPPTPAVAQALWTTTGSMGNKVTLNSTGLPTSNATCTSTPASCLRSIPIPSSAISQFNQTQIVLREDDILTSGGVSSAEWGYRGFYT